MRSIYSGVVYPFRLLFVELFITNLISRILCLQLGSVEIINHLQSPYDIIFLKSSLVYH